MIAEITGPYCRDANLSTSQACVPPIHRFAPEKQQEQKRKGFTINSHIGKRSKSREDICKKRTYQWRLVVSVQYDNEICDRQHPCRGRQR